MLYTRRTDGELIEEPVAVFEGEVNPLRVPEGTTEERMILTLSLAQIQNSPDSIRTVLVYSISEFLALRPLGTDFFPEKAIFSRYYAEASLFCRVHL